MFTASLELYGELTDSVWAVKPAKGPGARLASFLRALWSSARRRSASLAAGGARMAHRRRRRRG